MSQLWEMNAWDVARRIRAREISGREVVQAHLARIDEVNARVNAVTAVLAGQALADADAVDRALRTGEAPAGPLAGVPMTVKENIDLAGSATTLGIAALRHAIPDGDAPTSPTSARPEPSRSSARAP